MLHPIDTGPFTAVLCSDCTIQKVPPVFYSLLIRLCYKMSPENCIFAPIGTGRFLLKIKMYEGKSVNAAGI